MPPNSKDVQQLSPETSGTSEQELEKLVAPQADQRFTHRIQHWDILIGLVYINTAALYSITLLNEAKWITLLFMYIYLVSGGVSITMGAHRLWAHKTYKAILPLQILLMLCFSSVNEFSITWWVKIHRQHHKYSDTDADPHNATRGMLFAHMSWLVYNKHPEVVRRRPFVEVTDIDNDPVLQFQRKYDVLLRLIMAFLIPNLVPWLLGESLFVAWHLNILRIAASHHATFAVNSFSHMFGNKPYDKNIASSQNLPVTIFTLGEGFHNYHHVFPWDYRVAELGNNRLNFTTIMIDLFAKIGWVYDRKTVNEETIRIRSARTGDGTDSWGNELSS